MATYFGTPNNDSLYGSIWQDWMYGYGGDDLLDAHTRNDYLDGGPGNDTLVGGLDSDGLVGGPGADTFKYNRESETWGDAIWDYKYTENDKIDLSGIDAKTFELFYPSTWGDQAFAYKGYMSPGQGLAKGELGFQIGATDTYVYGNTDGDAAFEVNLRVSGKVFFLSYDFVL